VGGPLTLLETLSGMALLLCAAVALVALVADALVLMVRSAQRKELVGLFLLAWVPRWLAPPAPHDINDRLLTAIQRGPLDVLRFMDPDYGAGLPVWSWVTGMYPLSGVDLSAPMHAATLWGALSCVFLAAWSARLLPRGSWGLLAGGLLALSSVHVRFSHTDAQVVVELLLVLWALWRLTARTWTVGSGLVVGCGVALAASMRPESVLFLPFALALAWASEAKDRWRHLLPGAGVAAGGMLLASVSLWHRLLEETGRVVDADQAHALFRYGLRHVLPLDPYWVGGGGVLLLVGLVAGHLPRWRRVLLAVLVFGPSLMLSDWSSAGAHGWLFARHQLRALPFASVLMAAGGSALVAFWPGRLSKGLVGLLSASTMLTLPRVAVSHVLDAEWALTVRVAQSLPSEEVVLYRFAPHTDVALSPRFHALPHGVQVEARDLPSASEPVVLGAYYVRTAACSLAPSPRQEWPTPPCDRFERRVRLQTLWEERVGMAPWFGEVFKTPLLRRGLYRIEGVVE